MPHNTLNETRKRLRRWGAYMDKPSGAGGCLDIPKKSALLNINTTGSKPAFYDDPDAWEIESVLIRLKQKNKPWYQSLLFTYQYNETNTRGAELLKVSLAAYKIIKNNAEAWVDGRLDAMKEKAA